MNHVYITVGKRRWCVCCDLFQQGKFIDRNDCPNDAPAADVNRIVYTAPKRNTCAISRETLLEAR